MNWTDWYTDLVDIYRVESKTVGALTKQERVRVAADIPCRIYRSPAHSPKFSSPAAYSEEEDKLACDNQVDVQAGFLLAPDICYQVHHPWRLPGRDVFFID